MIIYTVNAVEEIKVKRTWKERLFSFPWRPFQKIRIEKKPTIFQVGAMLLVHPVFESQYRKEIEEFNNLMEHPVLFGNRLNKEFYLETVKISENPYSSFYRGQIWKDPQSLFDVSS
jgi:hypothetical protein